MLVSFIIPSYNSAQTVKRCLDSIYALPLEQEEFEVIFIDDCSTDNTCEIVEAYSRPLPEGKGVQNLVLLKQPTNNRQGAARNRGVSMAKGEYICFVDSDDAVTEGVADAIRIAKDKQTDMTAFHTASANELGQIISAKEHLSFAPKQIFSGIEMQNIHSYWFSGPVAYIYSKAFLDRVNYPFCEGVLYEDADFVMIHLYYAKRMVYSQRLGYVAYFRQLSTTRNITYKNIADWVFLGIRMLTLNEIIEHDLQRMHDVDKATTAQFAEDVLDGACWNVASAFKRLFKLKNAQEMRFFYERLDTYVNRSKLYNNPRIHKYPNYWSYWARLCIKHKYISIVLNSCLSFAYHIYLTLARIIFKKHEVGQIN